MIVRELLAVFGLGYDRTGQQEAERGIDSVIDRLGGIQRAAASVFGVIAAVSPLALLAKLGSDAQESLNLLEVSFDENADSVVEWADRVGPAMGRSRFTMRELAAEFGGLLRPMVGAGKGMTDMSTKLAEVAVDLRSLRNIPLSQALNALRSGMTGETEAVKRFGINLKEAAINAEIMRLGLGTTSKGLSEAKLAQVRYNIIVRDMAFLQGDSANTTFQFANSLEALKDSAKDIATEIGLFMLPALESTLKVLRGILKPVEVMVREFTAWARETNLMEGALLGIGLAIATVLLPVLGSLLIAVLPLIVAIGIFAVVMDEVITTLQGGDSLIGRLTTKLDQLEKDGFPGVVTELRVLIQVFNLFRDVLGGTMLLIDQFFTALTSGDWAPFHRAVKVLKEAAKGSIGGALRGLEGNQGVSEILGAGQRGELPHLGLLGGGESSRVPAQSRERQTVTLNNAGGNQYTFNVTQEPGESSEAFAERIKDVIDADNTERATALYKEAVQGA